LDGVAAGGAWGSQYDIDTSFSIMFLTRSVALCRRLVRRAIDFCHFAILMDFCRAVAESDRFAMLFL